MNFGLAWGDSEDKSRRECSALRVSDLSELQILTCLFANSELVDGGDVFVPQRCGCAGFAHKTFAGFGASPVDSV